MTARGQHDRPRAPQPRPPPADRGRPATSYHLGLRAGTVPDTFVLTGDPDRVAKITATWEEVRPLGHRREFVTYAGRYHDVPIGVTSTGIGGPAMSIVVEELAQLGVGTFVRVGSSGSLQATVRVGDLVITRATFRLDGASLSYAPAGFPASADPEVYGALVAAARASGVRFHTGITASVDSFYSGQGRPGFRGFVAPGARTLLRDLAAWNVTNIEMESGTLLTLAGLFGLRAGVVCAVYDAPDQSVLTPKGDEAAIRIANEAIRRLARTSA
jgi:uridine phosphorylase